MSLRAVFRPTSSLSVFLAPVVTLALYVAVLAVPRTRPLGLKLLLENGPVEWATFAFLCGAGVLGLRLLRSSWRHREGILLCGFLTLFGGGLLGTAMEEIAWGQWVFGFETPEVIKARNRQGELTLHNLDGLHPYVHYMNAAFGVGGLIGVALGRARAFRKVAAPRVLVLWFLTEASLAIGAIYVDAFTFNEQLARCVRRLSELNELLISVSALLYVRTIAAPLQAGWRRREARPGVLGTEAC
jgi:hypothetical protein